MLSVRSKVSASGTPTFSSSPKSSSKAKAKKVVSASASIARSTPQPTPIASKATPISTPNSSSTESRKTKKKGKNKSRKIKHHTNTQSINETNCKGILAGAFLLLAGVALMTYHGLEMADITPSMGLPDSFLTQLGVGTASGLAMGGGALWIKRSLNERVTHEQPVKPSRGAYGGKLMATIAVVAALLFASAQFCQGDSVDFDLFDIDSTPINCGIGTVSGLVILNAIRFSLNYHREKKRYEQQHANYNTTVEELNGGRKTAFSSCFSCGNFAPPDTTNKL